MLEISSQMGGCINVVPESAEVIAMGIKSILLDKNLYENLKEQCRRATRVTWKEYAQAVLNFIKETSSIRI